MSLTRLGMILTAAALHATPLLGQVAPRAERWAIEFDVAGWRLDGGTVSAGGNTRWGPTLRLVRALGHRNVQVGASVFFAGEGSYRPGLLALSGIAQTRIPLGLGNAPGLMLSAEAVALRFNADRLRENIEDCHFEEGCFFEGVSYRSGWRPAVGVGAGLHVPLDPAVALSAKLHFLGLLGSGSAGSRSAGLIARPSVGVAWAF